MRDPRIDMIETQAALIGALQEICRIGAMIYQRELKEAAARWNGQAPEAYYNLSFSDWEAIRDQYLQEFNQGMGR